MKASRRKIICKGSRKDTKTFETSQDSVAKARTSDFMDKILNLTSKNFQIPERRGTIIGPIKRFSNLDNVKIPPSETDWKANLDDGSSKSFNYNLK